MEDSLREFSFEKLNAQEATHLKKSFEVFKKKLEDKIFDPAAWGPSKKSNVDYDMSKIPEGKNQQKAHSTFSVAELNHEFKIPLNRIIRFTSLLKGEAHLNTKQLEQVNAIQKASVTLVNSINELLAHSKPPVAIQKVKSIEFTFRTIIGNVMYLCSTLISNKAVKLNVEIDETVPNVVIGDPSKLTEVLLNILGNAIKRIKKGSIDIRVIGLINQKQEKNATILRFSISAVGIGASKENLAQIFETNKLGHRDSYRKYAGSGIGLHRAKQLVGQVGGSILVISELHEGTALHFTMPFKSSTSAKPSKAMALVKKTIDLSAVLEECMGEIGLLEELVLLYKQNALEFIGMVKLHLQDADSAEIGFAVHKIKTGLKLFKTNSLLKTVVRFEKCCQSGADIKYAKFIFQRFLYEYPIVENAIDLALNELKNRKL